MKRSKKTIASLMLAAAIAAPVASAKAQVTVIDPTEIGVSIQNLAKNAAMLSELASIAMMIGSGSPYALIGLVGFLPITQMLSATQGNMLIDNTVVTGQSAPMYQMGRTYTPVTPTTASGNPIPTVGGFVRPDAVVQDESMQYAELQDTTNTTRTSLLTSLQTAMTKLNSATSLNEIEKINGYIAICNGLMMANQQMLDSAFQTVQTQAAQNAAVANTQAAQTATAQSSDAAFSAVEQGAASSASIEEAMLAPTIPY